MRAPTGTLRRPARGPSIRAAPGGCRARNRHRLADACALVPRILATESRSLPRDAVRAVVARAQLTSTDMAVLMLAPVREPPCLVVKMPMSAEAVDGLERETGALTALRADLRLGAWRDLIPRPCTSGQVGVQSYRIDAALTGGPILDRVKHAAARGVMLETGAETIDVLHRTTATRVFCDAGLARRWVDEPVDELLRHGGRRRSLAPGLERLRAELHEALGGGMFFAAWIHGDYWLGNLLFSVERSAPAGIVDWDRAAPLELPLHDLLHLLLYTRRLVSGEELGQVIRRQLTGAAWSPQEQRLLDRYAAWRRDGSLSDRNALLLYWLRHVALHARQQPSPAGYRYRLWERRNVDPILAVL
jgi:aminoglycoside phosphotransferase (APT) family kinase protein